MAKAAVLEDVSAEQPGTDIVVAVTQNPGIVLLDRQQFDAWYDKLKAEAPEAGDMSVKRDRDTLRSFAAKVRGEKAAIDKARLRLTEEWRTMTTQANDAGKEIKARLEALETEVRAPLTAWEAAEEARVTKCNDVIAGFRAAMVIAEDDTADSVRERGTAVYGTAIHDTEFGDMAEQARFVRDEAIATLKRALARLTQEEADRAELAKLRAEREDAERIAAEKAAAEEVERRRVEEARIADERRIAAERAAAEREEQIKQEAAEAAQRAADAAAQVERDRIQAEHEQALAAERKRAEEAERAVSRGREMLAYIREVVSGRIGGQLQPFGVLLRELEIKVVADDSFGDMRGEIEQARIDGLASINAAMERQAARRQAEEDRVAEQARLAAEHERQTNKANRAAKKTAAKQAIMTCGASEDAAQKIVLAIIAGEVPGVSLAF